MTARTFGRKGQAQDEEMARRREAFIAEERARREKLEQEPPEPPRPSQRPVFGGAGQAPAGPTFIPEKSLQAAYLFWFFFGAIGAHRFYLGHANTGMIQAGMWLFGWVAIMSGNLYALAIPLLAGLWVLVDAFLIPSMTRDANARLRGRAVHYVFT